MLSDGRIRYTLKTPYRDGTTHVLFEPLDFLARLAALVPNPKVNLTRYHGVFAPNHRLSAHHQRTLATSPRDDQGELTVWPQHQQESWQFWPRPATLWATQLRLCVTRTLPLTWVALSIRWSIL
jgi:hypothetical protein